jgi:hypothetical protein
MIAHYVPQDTKDSINSEGHLDVDAHYVPKTWGEIAGYEH